MQVREGSECAHATSIGLAGDRGRIEGGRHEVDSKEPCIGSGVRKGLNTLQDSCQRRGPTSSGHGAVDFEPLAARGLLAHIFHGVLLLCLTGPLQWFLSSGFQPRGKEVVVVMVSWLCEDQKQPRLQRVEGQGGHLCASSSAIWDASAGIARVRW